MARASLSWTSQKGQGWSLEGIGCIQSEKVREGMEKVVTFVGAVIVRMVEPSEGAQDGGSFIPQTASTSNAVL